MMITGADRERFGESLDIAIKAGAKWGSIVENIINPFIKASGNNEDAIYAIEMYKLNSKQPDRNLAAWP